MIYLSVQQRGTRFAGVCSADNSAHETDNLCRKEIICSYYITNLISPILDNLFAFINGKTEKGLKHTCEQCSEQRQIASLIELK